MDSQLHDEESKDVSRVSENAKTAEEVGEQAKAVVRKRHFFFKIPKGKRLTSLDGWPHIYLDPDLA